MEVEKLYHSMKQKNDSEMLDDLRLELSPDMVQNNTEGAGGHFCLFSW